MKKKYVAPEMLIIKVAPQQMIADSGITSSGLDGLDGYGGIDTNGSKDPSSRRRGFWDDDDEDW